MSDFFGNLFNGQGPVTTSTSSAGSFATPYWQNYLQGLNTTIGNNPITPYGGPTVAPQNFMQQSANDMMYNFATGGTPAGNMANSAITAQASGANLANPYATTLNPFLNAQNSYLGATNPYEGNNPYLQQMVQGVNQNMADAYAQGTAAQTAGAFNQAGAYGGSAYQDTQALNNKAFANALGNTDANIYGQNYYNSGQLAQNDLSRNASLAQQGIQNQQQLGEDQLNRSTGAYQNGLSQQLGAAGLGLESQGVDLNSIMGLNTLGTQQQGNTQDVLNAMGNYYTQQRMAPYIGLDLMGQGLTAYSNANRTATQQLPGSNPFLNTIGLIGTGSQLLMPFFTGSGS